MTVRDSRMEASALAIATAIHYGAKAEIVSERLLQGLAPSYIEIDGVPVYVPAPLLRETPGVRVTFADGYVALYLTSNSDRARTMLERAQEVHDGA